MWSKVGHPILCRSFCRVLRPYANRTHPTIFSPLRACYSLFVILPCFITPYMYVCCHGNLVFFFSSTRHYRKFNSTLSKIQHPNIYACTPLHLYSTPLRLHAPTALHLYTSTPVHLYASNFLFIVSELVQVNPLPVEMQKNFNGSVVFVETLNYSYFYSYSYS